MSGSVPALVGAIVGVVGALAATVVTQLFLMRTQRDQRREERWRTMLKDRRDSCVALNVETRRFQQMLLSRLDKHEASNDAELEEAWQALTSCYSEARIILPESVAGSAGEAFGKLKDAYDRVVAYGRISEAGISVEREELRQHLEESVGHAIRELREASRDALGSDLPIRPPK